MRLIATLELASFSVLRRAQHIDSLLERTLAEQAKLDKETRLPRGFIAGPCAVILKGGSELRVRRRMRRTGICYRLRR